ncbi:MAG: ribosome maturation factor RimM [Anaerolineaceae bacterium]
MSRTRREREPNEILSGSPQPGEPVYLAVARLRRPHGIAGEILMEMITDTQENLSAGKEVYIGEEKIASQVIALRPVDKLWLITLTGFEDRESVARFSNQWLYMKIDQLQPLPEGRFYHHEVIGMQVLNEADKVLGVVSEILITGANDVYVVKNEQGEEMLVPVVKSVIQKMDRKNRTIVIRPQEWE